MEKCECYIHSLKQGETHVLGEATILKRIGDNDYLAEYNGVKCHAIFNPFAGRYFVDDVYGVIRSSPDRDSRYMIRCTGQVALACPYLPERRNECE